MKTIIAGSTTITHYHLLLKAIRDSNFIITEVVSGTADGVDKLGERYAEENDIKLTELPANWDLYGKWAGMIRNKRMAKCADQAIILYDGYSHGTRDMMKLARAYNLKTFIELVKV